MSTKTQALPGCLSRGLLALCTATGLHAQTLPQPAAANPTLTPYAKAAASAGIQACAGRIQQVTQFITANSQSAGFLFMPPAQPDQRLVTFSFEVQATNAPTVYASATFAPRQANDCGAEYEAVAWWPDSCDAVAAKQYAQLNRRPPLHKDILMLEGLPSARVFLMPAGSGCVSIKKEVVN